MEALQMLGSTDTPLNRALPDTATIFLDAKISIPSACQQYEAAA